MDDYEVTTPRGHRAKLGARAQTSDLSVIGSSFAGVAGSGLVDEYGLRDLHISGRFVDVGAHVGSVTVAVLLDNPDATALCVEPIPENIACIAANLAANGLLNRASILPGAVGTGLVYYGFEGTPHLSTNRYIANLTGEVHGERPPSKTLRVRQLTLTDLLPAAAMKVDCEGGEWALFADPAITSIPLVFGEWHGNPGADGIRSVFGKTHDVTFSLVSGATGNFRAVAR